MENFNETYWSQTWYYSFNCLHMFCTSKLLSNKIFVKYCFIFSLLSLVGNSVKYLFPLTCWKYPFVENKILRIYTINFYVFRIFDRHLSNIVNKNIFVWLFIYFNIIRIKNLYIDNIIEKVVCAVFFIYIFDFITYFYNTFINIKLLLIHYLCSEMTITVLLDLLSNNIKY